MAVLRQMVKDARAGDSWAAWYAWVGVGFGLAMGLGLDVETWEGQLRQARISRPEREPPAPLERNKIEPPVLVFRPVGEGEPLRMGEIHRRGRPRKGQAPAPGKGWLEIGLAVRVEAADWEGRDIVQRLGQMLTSCMGDGRAMVAELVQDSEFVTRALCWANLAE